MSKKNDNAYKTIGEVAEILNLFHKKTGKLNTHTIRYWEKEFKFVKPKYFNNKRRYFDSKSIKMLQKIQNLLKVKGMTIAGVKKHLQNSNSFELDEINLSTIKANQDDIKKKVVKISSLIKELKKLS